MSMNGVLVVDKPAGPTSFDVVRRVRQLLRIKKVGHTGTLDPLATGVLPLCLGDDTRIAGYITEGDKAYDAVLKLGETTDTLDAQGTVLQRRPVPSLSAELLEDVLSRFRGSQLQTPPMYSAVKQGGKRLYELAREGKEVERAARPVTVHQLELRDFSSDTLTLSVECSKGFFVRTLAEEIGEALGCGAHIAALRRTRSGPFELRHALPLPAIEALVAGGTPGLERLAGQLVDANTALAELPAYTVSEAAAQRVMHGVPVEVADAPEGRMRVLDPEGHLLAIAEGHGPRLRYLRVLRSAGGSGTGG
jgi:tRNA pseudouridine55 synthase